MDFTPLMLLKGLVLPKKFFTSFDEKFVYPDFSLYVGREWLGYFWVDRDGSTPFTVRFEIQLRAYATFQNDMEYDKSRLLFRELTVWVKRCVAASSNRKKRHTESWKRLSKQGAFKHMEGSVLHGCLTDILYEFETKMPYQLVTRLSIDDYTSNDLNSFDVYQVKHFTVKVTLRSSDL